MCTADGVWIEDLTSTNGIFSGGKRIRRRRLEDGDSVKLGLHEITYHRDAYEGVSTGNLDINDKEEAGDLAEHGEESDNFETADRSDA